MKTQSENTLTLEDMKSILRERGIVMSVGGCGCCGSPGVTFTYEGKTFDGEDVNLILKNSIFGLVLSCEAGYDTQTGHVDEWLKSPPC